MKNSMKGFAMRRLVLVVAMFAPITAFSAEQAGTILVATNGVKAVAADGSSRVLTRNSPVFVGEKLVTGQGARVQVKFSDGSILALKPNTEMSVDQYVYEPQGAQAMFMSLARGGFRTVTGAIGKLNKKDYRISTPVATIGVRGTLHEGSFDPETGLSLAAWDGGTEACNSSGCLNLGLGADFRFGFVSLDGHREGRLLPPPGVGDGDAGGRDGGANGRRDGAGEGLLGVVRDLANDDRGLFIRDAEELLHGGFVPRYTGFAAVGSPRGLAQEYPWGTQRLLTIDGAEAELATGEGMWIESWSIQSSTTGGYINPGNTRPGSFHPTDPEFRAVATDKAWLVWGSWGGTDPVLDYGDVSLGGVPGVETDVGIPAAGFYAFGSAVPVQVFADLSGELSFSLFRNPQMPAQSFPQFFDATSPFRQFASEATGSLHVDLDSGLVAGDLEFTSALGGDQWHLEVDGDISSNRSLTLNVVAGVDGSNAQGSWYQAVESSPLGVDGTIKADFVGASQSLAILGGFDVYTIDTQDDAFATGLFLMDFDHADVATELSGFAVLGGPAGPNNSQNSDSLLLLDQARLFIGTDSNGDDVVLFGTMQSSTLGGKYILPGKLNADQVSVTLPPDDPQYTTLPYDNQTRIAWGQWMGDDMSVAQLDSAYLTQDGIAEPGAFLFGDTASPAAVARMTGTVGFDLLGPFPVFVDAAGVPQTGTGASGGMSVDVASGSVTGNMSFGTAAADQWSLVFAGNFSAISPQNLTLNVLGDPTSPGLGSHFIGSGGAGNPLEVSGTIKASFVGVTDVAGVVGAFDVQTVDTADTNFARGVFGMAIPVPGGGI